MFWLVEEVFSTLGVSVRPKGVFAVGVSILEASFGHGVGEVRRSPAEMSSVCEVSAEVTSVGDVLQREQCSGVGVPAVDVPVLRP